MDKSILIGLAIVALAGVNIAAFRYMGFIGLLFAAASFPLAKELLNIIGKM